MTLADILNPRLGDYPSPDTYLPSTTGSDTLEVSHLPLRQQLPKVTAPKVTAIPTTMPAIFGQSPTGIYRQLLTAFRSGNTAFDTALNQFNIPRTFSIPFGTATMSLTRSNGNVQIAFNNETLAVIPMLLIGVAYIMWCIVWLLLTHNANWHLISRVLGVLPHGAFPIGAALLELFWFRKGYTLVGAGNWKGLAGLLGNMVLPMFSMRPIPSPDQWFRFGAPTVTRRRRRRKPKITATVTE